MAVTDQSSWAFAALATPIADQDDGVPGPDLPRMLALATDLLHAGLNGIVPFGTTGEGPCFSVAQRLLAVDSLLHAGIRAERMIIAVGATALADTVVLAQHATAMGCPVLAPPPFFLREAGHAGLIDGYSRLIGAVGSPKLRLLLYNIPQVTGFPIPMSVVAALAETFPGVVIGVKDSALAWDAVAATLRGRGSLGVAVGAEDFIPEAMTLGGRGTICGLANIVPGAVAAAVAGDSGQAEALTRLVRAFDDRPFLPTLKAVLAALRADKAWRAPMPPIEPAAEAEVAGIVALARQMTG